MVSTIFTWQTVISNIFPWQVCVFTYS